MLKILTYTSETLLENIWEEVQSMLSRENTMAKQQASELEYRNTHQCLSGADLSLHRLPRQCISLFP